MKIKILIIMLIAFQFTISAQQKGTPCPPPKHKKGQTSAQVNEENKNLY